MSRARHARKTTQTPVRTDGQIPERAATQTPARADGQMPEQTSTQAPPPKRRAFFTPVEHTQTQHVGQYFTLLLFGMFVILLLMALWMGTVAFRTINTTQTSTDDARLALNSLQNRVRSFDEAGAFATGTGPEGPSIVFTYKLETGNYETRIYLYEGALVQELAFSDDPYLPMTATKIVQTQTFSFNYENGLLSVTTDQGEMSVALRSEAGTNVASGASGVTAGSTASESATVAGSATSESATVAGNTATSEVSEGSVA